MKAYYHFLKTFRCGTRNSLKEGEWWRVLFIIWELQWWTWIEKFWAHAFLPHLPRPDHQHFFNITDFWEICDLLYKIGFLPTGIHGSIPEFWLQSVRLFKRTDLRFSSWWIFWFLRWERAWASWPVPVTGWATRGEPGASAPSRGHPHPWSSLSEPDSSSEITYEGNIYTKRLRLRLRRHLPVFQVWI